MRASVRFGLVMASLAALSAAGCDETMTGLPATAGSDTPDTSGSLGLELTLANGWTIASVDYAITGNGYNRTGSIPVQVSTVIAGQIGGIPPGTGYRLTLSTKTTDGSVSCSGSSTFDVAPGSTTTLHVDLRCTLPDPNGTMLVTATTNMCPVVDEFMVVPASTTVGSSVSLTAAAHDPNGTLLTYAWTATAGQIGDAHAPVTDFLCTSQTEASVTLTITDGACPIVSDVQILCRCSTPNDCPGQDTLCGHRLCSIGGLCSMIFEPAGSIPAQQTPGDCHTLHCDGSGTVVNMVDDTDVPVDGNECTSDLCNGGTPSNPNLPSGTPCAQDSGQICDGHGACTSVSFRAVHVGDEVTPLSGDAAPVFILEFRQDGTLVGAPILLPAASAPGVVPLTLSGTGYSEGELALSADGRFTVLAGYAASLGTRSVGTSYTPLVHKVVARIDSSRHVDTSTQLDQAFTYSAVRAATSDDGSGFWVTGGGTPLAGVWYVPFASTGGTQLLDSGVLRNVQIAAGQLYASGIGVSTVGHGLPKTEGQSLTSLPGLSTTGLDSSAAFAFALLKRNPAVAGPDTLYIADDRPTSSGGGIDKWTFDGSTWSLVRVFQIPGNAVGFRGLAGILTGQGVLVLATTADAGPNRMVRLLDDGTPNPPMSVVYTVPANAVLRGVAIAPHP